MKLAFDIDETICATPSSRKYEEAVPYYKVIAQINRLFGENNEIIVCTSRGATSGIDYQELTVKQLAAWGVKYHRLEKKFSYDVLVDDRAITTAAWRKQQSITIIGFVAGCFDLLHAGHCLYLKEAKAVCDHLIAALQSDPSMDRLHKNKPIQSLAERKIQLEAVKYVDEILLYDTEADLARLLAHIKPDIRIIGSDSTGLAHTGLEHCDNIYYHNRNHTFSSSELRSRIDHDKKLLR